MSESLRESRREFMLGELDIADGLDNPFTLLETWYGLATSNQIPDANAMSLSTIDFQGFPVSRIVLLRELDQGGLGFYTNYQSAKGRDLDLCPKASVQFFWSQLERQVRVRGLVQKMSVDESDRYFASRPRDSQIGAWASPQSDVVPSRHQLEDEFNCQKLKFSSCEIVPRPPHWGGYRLVPDQFEFWQGRPNRMHDRLRAMRFGESWSWDRLAP